MICRECKQAVIGPTGGDRQMAKLGYRSCSLAVTPEEKARYHSGGQQCKYPGRVKNEVGKMK
jgi:hypothetical protein